MISRRRRFTFSILSAVPLVLTLVSLEVGFRWYAYHSDQELERAFSGIAEATTREKTVGDRKLRLKHIIRLSDNPRIIYELIPGVRGIFENKPLALNMDGFRGPQVSRQKPPDTLRLVGIGDSVMFGWGVEEPGTFLAVTAEMLEESHPGLKVDYVNAAVPGYNTAMEVETLKTRLLDYNPDIVVLNYVGNDLDLPAFIPKARPYLQPDKSYLYDFIRLRIKGRTDYDHRLDELPGDQRDHSFDAALDGVPPQYRDLIGVDGFGRAISELDRLTKRQGFTTVVLTHIPMPVHLKTLCEEAGFPVISTYPERLRYMRSHEIDTYPGSELTVSDKDAHPSTIGHRIMAEKLTKYLSDTGASGLARELPGKGGPAATRAR